MNLAIISDISTKEQIGIICSDYKTGDIAYFSLNNELLDSLDILTTNPLFFSTTERIGDNVMLIKEEISLFDSFYLLAINFNLPYPWEITEVDEVKGDIEKILEGEASKFMKRSDKNE